MARKRLKVEGRTTGLFCSVACGNHARRGTGTNGAVAQFKRRAGWSDERWLWERRLVELGLGMGRGEEPWLSYGHSSEAPRP
jgi:hypothetical protein